MNRKIMFGYLNVPHIYTRSDRLSKTTSFYHSVLLVI